MKYFKRLGIYKASNVTFNPTTLEAHSYQWWRFVAKIDGLVVFNNYRYSPSTGKHQSKVRTLLNELGIKINLEMPLAKGINSNDLSDLILTAEEQLCNIFLSEQLKKQERYQKAKQRKMTKTLETFLETQVHFRDYEIKPLSLFGSYNKAAIHQVVDSKSMESDVNNAIHNFNRDGFGSIVFYVGA